MPFPLTQRVQSRAQELAEQLHNLPRKEISADNPAILAGRALLKKHPRPGPYITYLKKELLAAKLHITSDLFDHNEGFFSFASKHHLDRYLDVHQDHLHIEENDIYIRVDNIYRRWSEVSEQFCNLPKRNAEQTGPWIYGPHGLQNKDVYDWTELEPFAHEDPALWDHKYIFEFCSYCSDTPKFNGGDHSWIRLRTPSGEVYSAGLYRPQKVCSKDNLSQPLRIKNGHITRPDISDYWPPPIHSLSFAIEPEGFERVKQQIEHDKRSGNRVFQLLDQNCTAYAESLARLVGVHIDARVNFFELFAPKKLRHIIDKITSHLPKAAVKPFSLALTVFGNLLQVSLGGTCVEKSLRGNHKPVIRSIRDIFNASKLNIHSPLMLAHKIIPEVEAWRRQQLPHDPEARFKVPEYMRIV